MDRFQRRRKSYCSNSLLEFGQLRVVKTVWKSFCDSASGGVGIVYQLITSYRKFCFRIVKNYLGNLNQHTVRKNVLTVTLLVMQPPQSFLSTMEQYVKEAPRVSDGPIKAIVGRNSVYLRSLVRLGKTRPNWSGPVVTSLPDELWLNDYHRNCIDWWHNDIVQYCIMVCPGLVYIWWTRWWHLITVVHDQVDHLIILSWLIHICVFNLTCLYCFNS